MRALAIAALLLASCGDIACGGDVEAPHREPKRPVRVVFGAEKSDAQECSCSNGYYVCLPDGARRPDAECCLYCGTRCDGGL